MRKQLPISDAAQLAGVSVNDLLNLAASDQIYLGAMLDPFIADGRDYAGRELRHGHLHQLGGGAETCILPHEAKEILLSGTATVRVWREPGYENGVSIPQLGETPVVYFLREPQKIGRDVLWVYEDELSLHHRGTAQATAPVSTGVWLDVSCADIEDGSEVTYSLDEHHQFLQAEPKPSDIEMAYSAWDVRTAAQLITIGCVIESESDAARLKNWPGLANGPYFIKTVSEAVTRAEKIAESSIKIGDIKEYDTPSNWLLWAESKGYDVEHLAAIVKKMNAAPAAQPGSPPAIDVEVPKAGAGSTDQGRTKTRRRWTDDDHRTLYAKSIQTGMTPAKLAAEYDVRRQAIEAQIKKAKAVCAADRRPRTASVAWKEGK